MPAPAEHAAHRFTRGGGHLLSPCLTTRPISILNPLPWGNAVTPMRTRTWTLLAALTLLTAGALALATSVQSQNFERQAVTDQDATAHSVDWQSHDPGMLRLSLAPTDNASQPHATVSLLDADGTLQGTTTLDTEWPRLDVHMQPGDEQRFFIHQTHDAEITILAEQGHPINWNTLETSTQTTTLATGDREPIKTQIVIDNEDQPVHMDLTLDGAVHDLDITATNPDEETVFYATAEHADAAAGHQLAPTLDPSAFQTGSLLVQLETTELDGTLGLTTHHLALGPPHVVHADDNEPQEEPTNATQEPHDTDDEAQEPGLIELRTLNPSAPLGVTITDTDAPVHIASEDEDARVLLFDPDDAYLGTTSLDQDPPEAADDEAQNGTWLTLPLNTTGEHILILDAEEDATLYAPNEDTLHLRGVDRVEHQAQATPEKEGFTMRSNATATMEIPGGVFGFAWTTNGFDVKRDIELLGPSEEVLYDATAVTADRFHIASHKDTADPIAGSTGTYTVNTETTSLHDEGITFTITHYER